MKQGEGGKTRLAGLPGAGRRGRRESYGPWSSTRWGWCTADRVTAVGHWKGWIAQHSPPPNFQPDPRPHHRSCVVLRPCARSSARAISTSFTRAPSVQACPSWPPLSSSWRQVCVQGRRLLLGLPTYKGAGVAVKSVKQLMETGVCIGEGASAGIAYIQGRGQGLL